MQMGGPAIPLASSGMRILARFIDGIIVGIAGFIISAILGAGSAFGRSDDVSTGVWYLAIVLGVAISWFYDAFLTSKMGGTPMKKAFGMRVVDAASGSPVSLQQATMRWVVPGALSLVPILGGLISLVVFIVSLVFLFSDKMRQTVSDKIGKTVVINSK
jgi:uncharacterized RDD family membrane protein YckC